MKASTGSPNRTVQDDKDSFNFREVVQKYIKHWRFFLFTFIATMSIAVIINLYTPPVYKIEAKFLIKEESSAMNLFDFSAIGEGGILPKGQKLANETIVLKSRAIAEAALDQLPFGTEYYSPGVFVDKEVYKNTPITAEADWNHTQLVNGRLKISWQDGLTFQLEFVDDEYLKLSPGEEEYLPIEKPVLEKNNFSFGEWIELPYMKFKVNFTGTEKEGSIIIKFRDKESLILQYTVNNIEIAPMDKISSILSLGLFTHHPIKGRDYLNKLMNVFLESELSEKNGNARNTVHFIDTQLAGLSDSLLHTEKKLQRFRSSHRTYDITAEGNTIFEKLIELEKVLSEEKFKKEYYKKLQSYLAREEYSDIVIPSGLGINDPVLNRLIEELIQLQSDKSKFLSSQTENSPTVREVNHKIEDKNASIREVLKNVYSNADMTVSDLENRINKIERQFGSLPQTEQNLLNIKRAYSLNENIYTYLLQRRSEAAISLASNAPSNKIIESAVLNFEPLVLKPILNYFLAVLLAFVIPITVISLIDFFVLKITEIREIEQKLKVPVIGYIGQNKYSPLVVLNQSRAAITEAFRAIRTNLNFIFPNNKAMTVMVTSTIAGEGKTFCAINLASVYSIGGKKSLLIGCDMHKRFRFQDFNISNEQGLSTYLSCQANDLASLIQKTSYEHLDVLVPGPVAPNPSELLISNRFEEMINLVKKQYDVIILDSAPLGLTNETLYLTRIADITLFVLRFNYSEKSFMEDINSLKEKKDLKHVYAIVNDIEEKSLRHSGYGYGYYAEDKKKQISLKDIIKGVVPRHAPTNNVAGQHVINWIKHWSQSVFH
jgi:capsular exopolysaccharide synthesis family protein